MNLFDIGLVLIFISFILVGFKNGVIRELATLIGVIVLFYLSFSLKGYIGNILCQYLPFFNFKGSIEGITTINILMYQTIAFMIVFSLLLGIYALLIKGSKIIQKLINLTIVLIIPSKILGAIVGFIKGYIVVLVFLIVLMIPLRNESIFTGSTIINYMLYNTPIISSYTNGFTNTVTEIYDLGSKVSKKEMSTNSANLKTLDIMLKHNMVDKNTIKNLVDSGKLKDIKDINSVLNNY